MTKPEFGQFVILASSFVTINLTLLPRLLL